MNQSIKLNTSCELINLTPLNPLISKCQIKVCYVSDGRDVFVVPHHRFLVFFSTLAQLLV